MLLTGEIFGLRKLEAGRSYAGYALDSDGLLWAGRIVARTNDGELVVVEQLDGNLGVVWAQHFSREVESYYYEMPAGNLLDGDPKGIKLTPKLAGEAAEMLITHRPSVGDFDDHVALVLRSCAYGWHNDGTSRALGSIRLGVFLEKEMLTGQTVSRLLEAAGRICDRGTCPS